MMMYVAEVSSIVTSLGVLYSIFQNFQANYRLVRVEQQTNGMSSHLVKLTATTEYARGLKDRDAGRVRKDKRQLRKERDVSKGSED